jgi:hypothetical protein
LPDVRNPGTNLWDLSFFKNNFFGEKNYNLQFRVEMFNAFKTPQAARCCWPGVNFASQAAMNTSCNPKWSTATRRACVKFWIRR